uniref:Uncharacterized protein n=1 Tax=Arundo donax TaxID=35708 RepID=A0A0A9DGB4_ARUDO
MPPHSAQPYPTESNEDFPPISESNTHIILLHGNFGGDFLEHTVNFWLQIVFQHRAKWIWYNKQDFCLADCQDGSIWRQLMQIRQQIMRALLIATGAEKRLVTRMAPWVS